MSSPRPQQPGGGCAGSRGHVGGAPAVPATGEVLPFGGQGRSAYK